MSEQPTFFEDLKRIIVEYFESKIQLYKIGAYEKIAKVTAVLFSSIVIAMLGFFLLFFLSISGGFYLRTVPMELGDTVELNLYFDQQVYNFIGLLNAKTTINLPDHGKLPVEQFKPYAFLNGKRIKKASAEVFFSTQPSRKPLRAILKAPVGSVSVTLVEGFDQNEQAESP